MEEQLIKIIAEKIKEVDFSQETEGQYSLELTLKGKAKHSKKILISGIFTEAKAN